MVILTACPGGDLSDAGALRDESLFSFFDDEATDTDDKLDDDDDDAGKGVGR